MKFENVEEKIIYAKISAHRVEYFLAQELDSFSSERLRTLMQNINISSATMEHMGNNSSYRLLTSNRKIIGPFIVFIKKLVRKLLFWYVEPVCERQTIFNDSATRSAKQLSELNNELIQNILWLSRELENIKYSQHVINIQSAQKITELENMLKERDD